MPVTNSYGISFRVHGTDSSKVEELPDPEIEGLPPDPDLACKISGEFDITFTVVVVEHIPGYPLRRFTYAIDLDEGQVSTSVQVRENGEWQEPSRLDQVLADRTRQ